MEVRQVLRLVVFGYFSFLPNLLSYWVAVVLPEVIQKNLHVQNPALHSLVASNFYSFFFLGLIAGAFAWPYLIRVMSKRMAILVGLFFQGFFTLTTGMTLSLSLLYAFRFLTGFFNNINTVGKDFIFEFAKPEYRQYAFSLKSSFTMLGMWVGPLLGYYIYVFSGRDFRLSMAILAGLYLAACVLFVVFFYLDFTPIEMEHAVTLSITLDDDRASRKSSRPPADAESLRMIDEEESSEEEDESQGIWEVIQLIWRTPILLNFVVVYLITNGIGTTKNVVLVFFMEEAWKEGGLGVSPISISVVNLFVFFACLAFLLISPLYVPSRISYMSIIRQVVVMTMATMLLMPALRDLLPDGTSPSALFTIYISYGVTAFFNQKLFSPFINFYLNDRVDKTARTAMNSISFVGSCIAATVAMTLVTPFFSISMHTPAFTAWAPYNKYFVFVLMDLFLVVSLFFLRTPKEPIQI